VIKDFKSYLTEEAREVYFTFGRMNPPTIGHGKVLDVIAKKAKGADYKVYVSQSQGPKDPLSYSDKVKHLRKMLPKHGRNIMVDKGVRSVFDIATKLYDQGYKRITMVVGEDRLREFEVLLNKYNGTKARHGFYNFEKISVVSAGRRDPDAEGVEGMSASKQRANAKENDYTAFTQGVPTSMSDKDTRKLFNDVRKGLGLKEETSFKRHIDMGSAGDIREAYVEGKLFELGDIVVIKESEEVGVVSVLGANYVIVECGDKKVRKWLDAVELVEKQDKDIKDREGTQPARYHSGLKKSTKVKRDAHFKAKKDGPAPGDATAKTKPSKYTKAFKDMYEDVSQKELDDLEKFGDRLLNKFDVDIEFTRHFKDRMNDKRNKPAITVVEIERLFKKMADNKGKKIKKHGNSEAILKDMQSDLNLPVVVNWKNGEFEVVNKTIMRKKGFKSPDPVLTYEGKMLDKLKSVTIGKKSYQDALKTLQTLLIRKKKEGGGKLRHGTEYYAAQVAKSYQGMSDRTLHKMLGEDCGAGEEGTDKLIKKYKKDTPMSEDAVKAAQERIKSEKDADKKKHDGLLDRARLARAKAKNASTKP
tara:strand:- start:668 stop:2428 length:1761 start_codon:yes stop_codon:yes gene_type:complete